MTAYRKKYSCEVTLLTLVEEWKQAVDRKELVTALPADMSKAFDSLCPALTIKKLKAYGFGNRSLDLGTGQKVWGGEGGPEQRGGGL